jgi:hypothetical protein
MMGSVVVPAFNEAQAIAAVLRRTTLVEPYMEILVFDDGAKTVASHHVIRSTKIVAPADPPDVA